MGTQGEIATKRKPVEERNTQEREGQRRMTKKRNIKKENTFRILQEDDTEPLQEREESSHLK